VNQKEVRALAKQHQELKKLKPQLTSTEIQVCRMKSAVNDMMNSTLLNCALTNEQIAGFWVLPSFQSVE
jgi:hypothetical protein